MALRSEREGELKGDGGLADAAFAGQDENDVRDVFEGHCGEVCVGDWDQCVCSAM